MSHVWAKAASRLPGGRRCDKCHILEALAQGKRCVSVISPGSDPDRQSAELARRFGNQGGGV